MNAFTKIAYGLPAFTSLAGQSDCESSLLSAVSAKCDQTACANPCIQASHIRG
jgi:hypothetical protein